MPKKYLITPAHGKARGGYSGAQETAYERGEEQTLSPRELQLVFLASYGIRDPKIAELLGTTYFTVCSQWRSAFLKTRTHNKAQLVAKMIRRGIIP